MKTPSLYNHVCGRTCNLLCILLLAAMTATGSAQTFVLSQRMGEDQAGGAVSGDPLPFPGDPLTSSIGPDMGMFEVGGLFTGSTPWTDGSPLAPASSGSTLAAEFSGISNASGNLGTSYTFNFAIEAWVKFDSLVGPQWVSLLGYGYGGGVGILALDDSITGVITGESIFTSVGSIVTDEWYHVAVVVGDGPGTNNVDLFVNGTKTPVSGSLTSTFFRSDFYIAGDEGGSARLNGVIDEVRIFTFAPGTFDVSMLNVVPEPSTFTLLVGVLALGLAAYRKRRA